MNPPGRCYLEEPGLPGGGARRPTHLKLAQKKSPRGHYLGEPELPGSEVCTVPELEKGPEVEQCHNWSRY